MTGNGGEHARPHVEEIPDPMPQILTQMVDRTVEDTQPQIVMVPEEVREAD